MKKKVLGTFLAAVMALSLAACGSSSSQEAAPAESSAAKESAAAEASAPAETSAASEAAEAPAIEPCTIKYAYWADNTDYSQKMQDIAAEFNSTNEYGITVVAEEIPWDGGGYSNTLFNVAMGGADYDCAGLKLTAAPMFYNNNLLEDLTPYVDAMPEKDDISQNLYDTMKEVSGGNAMYLMPWNVQILYVYYRPSIFEAAGVSVPTTYDELLAAIEKCTMDTDGDGKTDVYGWGMRGSSGGQEPWGSFIMARGGSWDDLSTPEAIQGMQDFIDIYQKGYCPPTATSDGFQEVIANFKSGLTAMTVHHIGSSKGMVEELGDDVDAFIFPAGKGQWTSMGDTENVMFSSSANKAAAFEWLRYLAVGEGQKAWCETTGQIPVSQTVQQGEYFQADKFMKVSFEGMDVAGVLPVLDTTTEWITNWPAVVSTALTGEVSAEECMKTLQSTLHEE